jgi:hypothetical protein
MPRPAVAKVAMAIALVIALGGVGAGAVGLYYYTSGPLTAHSGTSTASNSATGTASQSGSAAVSNGTQDATGQPQGSWAKYLGNIPPGYNLLSHQSNAPTFPCPPDMSPSACTQFQASCGNGICDPNERCDTCPIDCAPTGNLVCDPYTGRGGSPASVCQAYVNGQNFG